MGTLVFQIIMQQTLFFFGKNLYCATLLVPFYFNQTNESAANLKQCHPCTVIWEIKVYSISMKKANSVVRHEKNDFSLNNMQLHTIIHN